MTYFLEKQLCIGKDGKLVPSEYTEALVRPCNWDYEKVLDFAAGKLSKNTSMELKGQIARFVRKDDKSRFWHRDGEKSFNSIEEWLIYLNLEKDIVLDFEETLIDDGNFKTYTAKLVDLHTNKVLFDNTDKIVEMLMVDNTNKIVEMLKAQAKS